MLIRTQTNRPAERKAVILLVVIALLTLFAIIALSFLLYANAEANASKLFREGEANDIGLAGTSAEKMLNFFLKQFIYDVPDDNTGVYSALRGHSVGRSIYGANYDPTKATVIPNTLAFNGTGRLHTNGTSAPFMNPFSQLPTPFSVDDYQLINYTYYPGETYVVNGTNLPFLRDPERINPFPTPPPPGQTPWRNNPAQPAGQYTGGANAPYTYPDLNNMFLAAVKADGTVLMPSFFRPYTGFGPMDPVVNSWNWTQNVDQVSGNPTPWLKYMVLRPRPADNPGFPLPEDGGGDVKNLPSWSPGTLIPGTSPPQYWNNDSFWMDLGAPIITNKNGKKIKPLFAPLIIDLDGRINLNTSGNVRLNAAGPNPPNPPGHASNQGWGPWEVDISHVLNNNPAGAARPEWTNTFLGDASGFYSGRYGTQGYPGSLFNGQATGDGVTPHIYGQVDYDGTQEANTTNPYSISLPIQLPPAGSFSSFPTYNTPATVGGYGNNAQIGMPPPPPPAWPNYAGNTSEGYAHPLLYQYFSPAKTETARTLHFRRPTWRHCFAITM